MPSTPQRNQKSTVIFDPLYGFIKLTPVEYDIIHSPFFQRLRWVKQLGFSFYVFPGAEHSRFGHSIGVMYNAHKILESCERSAPEEKLMKGEIKDPDVHFNQAVRLGALLHDIGTFCFSHTTETSYIAYGETTKNKNGKGLADDHENLGAFVIKNTDYEEGITRILKTHGIDPQMISDLVKGVHKSMFANQILHSEIDCDRMDYLLRDAHYTGLKYGSYDRDYLLYHFQTASVNDQEILTIKNNAVHCVEDFLMSRFSWYSQVIRSPRGAKYDAIAEHICRFFLKKGLVYKYSDLLDMVENDPMKFFGFNDNYFFDTVARHYSSGKLDAHLEIKEMAYTLLLERGARTVRCDELKQVLLNQNYPKEIEKVRKKAEGKCKEIQQFLERKGGAKDWIITDLPRKDISFVKTPQRLVKDSPGVNLLLERDPVKISDEYGEVKLLADVESSVISRLQTTVNFIPNVFVSKPAYELLKKEGIIHEAI